ncbi:MAG TPA: cobalamin biosynthesis protein CbiX [Thiotrichales bacterium]|nr:cobalamin biosynthesis protein CbiX [Thiotrichales bacterium]
MKALLIVAHGSRREASNQEVRALTESVAARCASDWQAVRCAFLELAPPSIPEALESLVREGASEIVVVPWFLAAGRHVREDIPAEVAKVAADHPEVRIHITPHLGRAQGLAEAVLGLVAASSTLR